MWKRGGGTSRAPAPDAKESIVSAARQEGKFLPGDLIDGRWIVDAVIAEGGMGVVLEARHRVVHHHVALKMILKRLADNQTMLRRFEREACAANDIGHPGFVTTLDYGTHQGRPYFVMELLQGVTAGALVRRDGPFPPRRVIPVLRQTCEALQAAHDHGIIHRDIKAENIFLCEGDRVKVLDLGIAKFLHATPRCTLDHIVLGTPHAMSPEQCRSGAIDHRSDIYSVAVLGHFLCTGHFPFEGSSDDVIKMHQHDKPPRLPEWIGHPGFADLLLRNLSKDPGRRMQTMGDFARALGDLEASDPVYQDTPTLPAKLASLAGEKVERTPLRPAKRLTLAVALAGVAYVGMGGAGARWLYQGTRRPAPLQAPAPAIAQPPQARLTLKVQPPDSQVIVDGDMRLDAGEVVLAGAQGRRVRIEARHAGYRPINREITLEAGERHAVIALEPIALKRGEEWTP
jgi:serine/threonine-protein kinase